MLTRAPCSARVAGHAASQLADADHYDVPVAEGLVAEGDAHGRAHPVDDRDGRQRGGVAAAAARGRRAHDVAGVAGDFIDFVGGRAHIRRREVAPPQTLNELAVGAQLRRRLARGVAEHDGLATAEVQAGDRRFLRHGGGEAERISHGLAFVRVGGTSASHRARDPGAWSESRRWNGGRKRGRGERSVARGPV